MPTGREMLELARQHIGEPYDNVLVPKNNANWIGSWDCAEFMSWLVFQVGSFLYGCLHSGTWEGRKRVSSTGPHPTLSQRERAKTQPRGRNLVPVTYQCKTKL